MEVCFCFGFVFLTCFEILKAADSSVAMVPAEKKEEVPAEKPKAVEPKPKSVKASQQQPKSDQQQKIIRAAKKAGLDWSQMSDDEQEEFEKEYYSEQGYDESLRETILKELKPLLKQLNGVLSHPKFNKR